MLNHQIRCIYSAQGSTCGTIWIWWWRQVSWTPWVRWENTFTCIYMYLHVISVYLFYFNLILFYEVFEAVIMWILKCLVKKDHLVSAMSVNETLLHVDLYLHKPKRGLLKECSNVVNSLILVAPIYSKRHDSMPFFPLAPCFPDVLEKKKYIKDLFCWFCFQYWRWNVDGPISSRRHGLHRGSGVRSTTPPWTVAKVCY